MDSRMAKPLVLERPGAERQRQRQSRQSLSLSSSTTEARLPRVLRRALGLMHFARRVTGATATSLFMVDRGGKTLRGQISDWDWTRTSFVQSHLRDWPTVAQSLADGETRTISKSSALASEAVWFEPRGIVSTVCVPMRVDDRPLGILFFDFDVDLASREPAVDIALLIDVGERCARAVSRPPAFAENAEEQEQEEPELPPSSPIIRMGD